MNSYCNYTSKELCQKAGERRLTAVLPTGSIEQHGDHLPLSVDSDIAGAIAQAFCEDHKNTVCLAPVCYGARSLPQSGGRNDYDATVSMKGKNYLSFLEDIFLGYYRAGIRNMIVLNAHYENEIFLCEAAEEVKERTPGFRIVILSWWSLIGRELTEGDMREHFAGWEREHAGYCETSMMLYLFPKKVRFINEECKRNGMEGIYDNYLHLGKENNGVLSSSAGADREIGEKMFREVLRGLENIFQELVQESS